MAVEFVKEMTGRDGSIDSDTNKNYRRTFRVRTSVPDDGAYVVLKDARIPARGEIYKYDDVSGQPLYNPDGTPAVPVNGAVTVFDNKAVVINRRASQENPNDPQDWQVVVEYAGIDDPLAQPAEVDYAPLRYQKALVVDLKGKPVVNTAGDPFDGGIMVDDTRFVLTIVQPVLEWDPLVMSVYQDSINRNGFRPSTNLSAYPPGQCKLSISARRMRRAGSQSFFWLRTSVIEIDPAGWKIKVRNAGFKELVYGAGVVPILGSTTPLATKPIFVAPGMPAVTPQLLKPDGTAVGKLRPPGPSLPMGDPVPAPLEFDGYHDMDWSFIDPPIEY